MTGRFVLPPTEDIPVETCNFYHSFTYPNGEEVLGNWDMRGRIHDYLGGVELEGRTVLDVGCASGFLSFEMEKAGATVTSFDADTWERIAFIPVAGTTYAENRAAWREETTIFLKRLHDSYWYGHRRYKSRNRVFHGDVYDLPPELGQYDVVVVGQILVHLRDPITALASACARSKDYVVVVEGVYESEDTAGKIWARAENNGPPYLWWLLSVPLYRELFAMFGFQLVSERRDKFLCRQWDYAMGEQELVTMTARRVR